MKRLILIVAGATLVLLGVLFIRPNTPNTTKIESGEEVSFLKAPSGFKITYFAKNIPGARMMELDQNNNLWVSQTKEGKISKVAPDGTVTEMYSGLRNPHGIIFDPKDPNMLIIAEEHQISVSDQRSRTPINKPLQRITALPQGGRHTTRTLMDYDGRLLVSIGSSCDVCREEDNRRGTILSMNYDGSEQKIFATGLRNAVFITRSYVDGRIWATEMGRDNLGDELPPDEVNIIEEGGNYGWPVCFGKNIHDTQFDKNTYIRNPCLTPYETPSHIDLPAHSAPLGISFIPEEGWSEEYWYNALVAYHGSWNRSTPTGYKIVRLKVDAKGEYSGVEDFITGWLSPEGEVLGRPVDIKSFPGGTLFISDDEAGVIYKMSRLSEN